MLKNKYDGKQLTLSQRYKCKNKVNLLLEKMERDAYVHRVYNTNLPVELIPEHQRLLLKLKNVTPSSEKLKQEQRKLREMIKSHCKEKYKISDKCFLCGKVDNLKKCGICKRVYYCSIDCRKKEWKTHKKYCNYIKTNLM